MTTLLQQAFSETAKLPIDEQDLLAFRLLAFAAYGPRNNWTGEVNCIGEQRIVGIA
jgi:hypothetical protein